MNFRDWMDNEADMPMQDEQGFWYDAETGLYFNESPKSTKAYEQVVLHEFHKLNIKQLKELVSKRIAGVQYSLNKGYANNNLTEMASEIVERSNLVLTSKTKIQYFDLLDSIKSLANAANRAKPSQN